MTVAVADLGNGEPDLVVSNHLADTVSVLLGKGDGTFGAPTTYDVGDGPEGVAIADLNGDGNPDLAVANYADEPSASYWVTATAPSSPSRPTTLAPMPKAIVSRRARQRRR